MSISSVAFIGLGTMGEGMVRNLLAAGLECRGYNRSAGPAEQLAEEGMIRARSPREAVEGADAVITCVADDGALRSVALEHDSGVVGGLREGALWLESSTTSLELTRELFAAASERGADFLDAPMTGSKLGAASGTLTFMVGGPQRAFEAAKGLFDILGKASIHVGERVGMGQSAKFCLNMSQAVVLQGILEGYALARRLGVSVSAMSQVFENSAGKTGVGSFKTPYLEKGDYEAHFKMWLMHKDLHLALGQASRFRLPLPAASAVRTIYDQGVAEGLGDEDFLALAKLLERWGNLSFSEAGGEKPKG